MQLQLATASARPSRPGVTFFARAKKVTKESTPRVRARSSLHDERVPGWSDVLGVASTRHRVATKLSRPSWPADPLRAPLQPALPGVEQQQLSARFASPQNNARRSERCAAALACDVGPLMAHRAAERAQGSADKDVRRASSRQDVASKRCPEHVSSAGHPEGAPSGCAFSWLLLFAQAKRSNSACRPKKSHQSRALVEI